MFEMENRSMKLPTTPFGQAVLVFGAWIALAIPVAIVWILILKRFAL